MNLTTGVAEDTTDLRVWFLIKGNRALDILRKGVPLDLEKSKISKSNFLRTRLGEIQINILFKSLDEILVSVLRSHKDYMIEWFEVCTRRELKLILTFNSSNPRGFWFWIAFILCSGEG